MRSLLARISAWCVERPVPVLAAAALIALVAAVGALRLEADAGTDQLVDRDSDTYAATEEFKDEFGDDAIAVLVEGDLDQLLLTSDLGTLLALEGCLGGNTEGGQVFNDEPAPEPCAQLAETRPAKVVYGPATFLNQLVEQASRVFSEQEASGQRAVQIAATEAALEAKRQGLSRAEQAAAAQAAAAERQASIQEELQRLILQFGDIGIPSLDNPAFVSAVVFGGDEQPKPRFSYLFPSSEAALISVRLRPQLDDAQRREAIEQIRAAVADPAFAIRDAGYVVSGVPVLVEDVAASLADEIFVLLAIAIVVMALALWLFVSPPLRLLPLAIALGAAALTFGGLALFGGSLTLASLACLPVLIGLAVDYSIQFQARFAERVAGGSSPARAAVESAYASGPVIGAAVLATAAGFAVLLLWPLPVVRTFGLLLLAGIAFAFVLAATVGLAALSLVSRRPSGGTDSFMRGVTARLRGVTGARDRFALRLRALGRRLVGGSIASSGRLLAIALVVAIAGWAVGTRTEIVADIRALLPSDLAALEEIEELEQSTGVSGEVDVAVTAPDLTDPELISWMADYKQRVLANAGFGGEEELCQEQDAPLCPSIALPDLFGVEGPGSRARVKAFLDLLPPYFSQALVSIDPETGALGQTAVIAFGIKVMPFDEQKRLIDSIRAELDPPGSENDPPEGVTAEVVGLPALVADASASLDRDRLLLTIGGLLAVALALFAIYRSIRRVLVPLIPIVLATGWSSLAIWIFGIELNPMSATLGALVIAIATEFSVLLAGRYEEERAGGRPIGEALRGAYSRTGMAVVASGVTAIAGFAVLAASGIPLLRDFGLVTVLDLTVALVGVLLVLPAALVWAEGGFAPFGRLAGRERAAPATERG